MKKLLDFIKNDWDILTDKDEIEVLMKYIQRGYYLGILYAGKSLIVLHIFCKLY